MYVCASAYELFILPFVQLEAFTRVCIPINNFVGNLTKI